jgi:redox-sensitive bicupin YhaK (pirin superfamily)
VTTMANEAPRTLPLPTPLVDPIADPILQVIPAAAREVDGFPVGRVLPAIGRRMIGPFAFFDHMGPATLAPGQGLDVRPHPHINLATVTYLFDGAITHRDTLGVHQVIRPGDINWMTAGRGIAHSERTPPEVRVTGSAMHGIQLWVALPQAHEETEPEFHHHPGATLPSFEQAGVRVRVLVGAAYGQRSPVRVFSPMFYLEASWTAAAELEVPSGAGDVDPDEGDQPGAPGSGVEGAYERAAYVAEGRVSCGGTVVEARNLIVFAPGTPATLRADGPARVLLLGGAPLDGPRTIWWNFVSSSRERIERAKADWREGRFGTIPGDEHEFIPLPEK